MVAFFSRNGRRARLVGEELIRYALGAALGLGLALSTTGCGALFLYELFKDDDEPPAPAPEDAGLDATPPPPSPVAPPIVVPPDAVPPPTTSCTTSSRCTVTATSREGACSLARTCEELFADGAPCVASWQCKGELCAWDESAAAGRCTSQPNACKRTTPGCTPSDHACCEGSRCLPAMFGAEAQCALCMVRTAECDAARASECCSGRCTFGQCE